MSETKDTDVILIEAIERLLSCPDLSLDQLEEQTGQAVEQALEALQISHQKKLRRQSPG